MHEYSSGIGNDIIDIGNHNRLPASWILGRGNPACPVFAAYNRFRFGVSIDISSTDLETSGYPTSHNIRDKNSREEALHSHMDERLEMTPKPVSSLAFEEYCVPDFDDSDSDSEENNSSDAIAARFIARGTSACVVVAETPATVIGSAAELLRRTRDAGKRCLVIVVDDKEAKRLASEIAAAIDEIRVTFVPAKNATGRRAALQYLSKARRPGIFVIAAATLRSFSSEVNHALTQGPVDCWDYAFVFPSSGDMNLVADCDKVTSHGKALQALTGSRVNFEVQSIKASSWVALLNSNTFHRKNENETNRSLRTILRMLRILSNSGGRDIPSLQSLAVSCNDYDPFILDISDVDKNSNDSHGHCSCVQQQDSRNDLEDHGEIDNSRPVDHQPDSDSESTDNESWKGQKVRKPSCSPTPKLSAKGTLPRHVATESWPGVVDTDEELDALIRNTRRLVRYSVEEDVDVCTDSPDRKRLLSRGASPRKDTSIREVTSKFYPSSDEKSENAKKCRARVSLEQAPVIIISDSSDEEAVDDNESLPYVDATSVQAFISRAPSPALTRKTFPPKSRQGLSSCKRSSRSACSENETVPKLAASDRSRSSRDHGGHSTSPVDALSDTLPIQSIGRSIQDLNEIDRVRYNRILKHAQSLENSNNLKSALSMYTQCLEITDADHSLQLRVIALGLETGVLANSDFHLSEIQARKLPLTSAGIKQKDSRQEGQPIVDVIVLD